MTTPVITKDPYRDILEQLLKDVLDLRQKIAENASKRLKKYSEHYRSGIATKSAINLAHYLALRKFDLRHLQDRLAQAGLSSLGRAESSVLSTLDALIDILQRATDKAYQPGDKNPSEFGFTRGQQLLEQHTLELFGPYHKQSKAHVMITLATEAAWNYELIQSLLKKGMTCARINCAHDDPGIWQGMIGNIRRAETETGHPCRILMDLAGHKIRTGTVTSGPAIHHIRVKKDRNGKITAPGRLILTTGANNEGIFDNYFRAPIPEQLHNKLAPGKVIGFTDQRNKQRYLQIEKTLSKTEWLVSCQKSAYLKAGSPLLLLETEQADPTQGETFMLGNFTGLPLEIRVFKNQTLLLTEEDIPGLPAEYNKKGEITKSAQIGCTLSSAINKLQTGDPVWIDDGKLGAMVEDITDQGALLRITQAKPSGVRIQSDKGINFPETQLQLPPLSNKDLTDLDFAAIHADLIGFSFVESLSDMEALMHELEKRNASDLPIIAKIETNTAVKNLPDIILGTIGRHHLGIMIARGDLSVELGSARLAEIQEELLWLCEAAHVPVIWATQVLESIAKKGTRSRPEFTDAAMAVRAECVMLNKGPYILDALEALVNVITRMQEHQRKKFSRLRALQW